MNITAATPPDWWDHFWQPLVLPTRTVTARYTARPEWSSDGESIWMRLSKFSLFNRLSLHALSILVAIRADEAVDLRRADQFALSQLASLLDITQAAALDGFCLPSGHPALAWAATELRYCPTCLEAGFHAAWFQWEFIEQCPLHRCHLLRGCRRCATAIPYALDRKMAMQPLSCAHCGTSWVPELHRPAGCCVPVIGRNARIFKRWQVHVTTVVMPVASTPPQARDRATGQYVTHWAAGNDGRMAYRAHGIRLLNRLYDVPPPSSVELLPWYRAECSMQVQGQMAPLSEEDWETSAIPWTRDDWPHFGDDFLAYEQILTQAWRDLFGDTRRIAPMRRLVPNRYDALVAHTRDMSADQATALGWSISWYGVSRTYMPEYEPRVPAVGLTGWLAHTPHCPAEVPPDRWREQMFAWLAHDLVSSAYAWERIVRFMRARGRYLLYAQLLRPAELARLHPPLQSDAPSFSLVKTPKGQTPSMR